MRADIEAFACPMERLTTLGDTDDEHVRTTSLAPSVTGIWEASTSMMAPVVQGPPVCAPSRKVESYILLLCQYVERGMHLRQSCHQRHCFCEDESPVSYFIWGSECGGSGGSGGRDLGKIAGRY